MNRTVAATKRCVVLDANVWISQMLLNSSVGAAFLYRLRLINGMIGLPEVVELEVMMRMIQEAADACQAIDKNLAKVRSLMGETPEINHPTNGEFRAAIRDRFSTLGEFIERIPIKPDHYRHALMKVIEHIPPNATREQYRDSLIWEAVSDLAQVYDIALVTNDKDFYESKDLQKGLALELRKKHSGREVVLFSTLEQFLGSFREKVPMPDYDNIASIISAEIMESVQSWADRKHFSVGEVKEHSIQAFVTEKVGVLSLSFKLTYRIFNVVEAQAIQDGKLVQLDEPIERAEASLVCSGDCYFDQNAETVSEMRPRDFDCFALDGRELVGFGGGNMYAVIGSRSIPHRILRPIDQT